MGAPNEDDASYCGEGQANANALSQCSPHSAVDCSVRRVSASLRVLHSRPPTDRASLAVSLPLMGSLTPGTTRGHNSVFLRSHIALPYRAVRKPLVRWVNE